MKNPIEVWLARKILKLELGAGKYFLAGQKGDVQDYANGFLSRDDSIDKKTEIVKCMSC